MLQAFGEAKPMFGQCYQICVVFDKNRYIELRTEHGTELDVSALEDRAPVHGPGRAINVSGESNTDTADFGKLHLCFPDAGPNGFGHELGQLRRSKFERLTRDIFRSQHIAGEIGERYDDLV